MKDICPDRYANEAGPAVPICGTLAGIAAVAVTTLCMMGDGVTTTMSLIDFGAAAITIFNARCIFASEAKRPPQSVTEPPASDHTLG